MKKISGFNTLSEGLTLTANIKAVKGTYKGANNQDVPYADGITQVYDNSTGNFSPDHAVHPLVLETEVKGYNPNVGKSIAPKELTVTWYKREPGGSDTQITSTNTSSDFYLSGQRLVVKKNIPAQMSGLEIWSHATFGDQNDPLMAALQINAKRIRLSTAVNVVNNLLLQVATGTATDFEYVADGYTINPFEQPQNDAGTAWKRRLCCQLVDGTVPLADAHQGTQKMGNGFYFWYYLGAGNVEIPLTGDEEWFSCTRYSDGTYAKECVVDLAKNTSVTLVCRAGYAAYGSLADITQKDGTISRSALQYGFLVQTFHLSVQMPVLAQIKDRPLSHPVLMRSEINNDAATTHVIKQALIVAGGMTVNDIVNPVTKTKNYTVNGDVQYFDKTKNIIYSDAVARNYNISWVVEETGEQVGTGEFMDKTLEELGIKTVADASNIHIALEVEPKVEDLFGNNFVVGYSPTSDDPAPLHSEIHGNKAFLKELDFMLYDTTTEDDSGTFAASTLQRNNLFHYKSGNYAPTVGITQAMHDECNANDLYTDSACKTLAYAKGSYNEVTEWEQHDKALMAAGGKPRTLYKKASDGTISEVSHKLRPWETTETKDSIGLGYEYPVYLLDQVKGKSGKVWKGIFTDVTEWDGIDLTPYKLNPTALGPGAFCTVGGKARNFFYLYQGETNCQGEVGNGGAISCFHEQRTYPCSSDVNQISSMTYCRANNNDANAPYPSAEGGYFAIDTLITSVELTAGTKYLHAADKFGSGISSNDGTNASNFFKVGGVRYKKASDTSYKYETWGTSHTVTVGGNATTTNWSQLSSYERAKEQCMESQMALSMAVELGIKPTTSATDIHYFFFYGSKYYYMTVDGMTTPADGQMNARVYKVIDTSYTDDKDGKVDIEFILRMSLYSGAMLAGDVFVYCGGGAELVAKAIHTRDQAQYNNPVGFWLEIDQKKWKKVTSVTIGENDNFGFETSYKNLIPLDGNVVTKTNNWVKNRFPYTPFANDSSIGWGDSMYIWNDNWYNTAGGNKKTRLALRFGFSAFYGFCAPRSLTASTVVSNSNRNNAGRAQALVRIAQ